MNQPKTNDLQAQLADLFNRINYERRAGQKPFDFKLDGIKQLLEKLDNPHLKTTVIHVAGTKGKGSVSKMIGAILSESGYKTGVYTSPHLECVNQRISIDNQWIRDDDLADILAEIEPAVAEVDQQSELAGIRPLTFFEVITTAAFAYFAKFGCKMVVLEVGMGGRLDSTNVCEPSLTVITNINLDHTRQLGDTLEKIAAEKGGIIKPKVPLVCGVTKRKPKDVIHQIAQANEAPVWQLGQDFFVQSTPQTRLTNFDTWGVSNSQPEFSWNLSEIQLSLLGNHQASNASIAIASIQRLIHDGWKIDTSAIGNALKEFVLPGRSEIASEAPPVVMDMAHNVASIEALIETLNQHFPKWQTSKRKRLLLSISKDKDSRGILRWLVDNFDEIILTQYQSNPRAKPIEDLMMDVDVSRDGLRTDVDIKTASTPENAWKLVQSDVQPDDFIVVTGSVFLVAELRTLLIPKSH